MVRKVGTHSPPPLIFLPRKELLIGGLQTVRRYDKYDHGKNYPKRASGQVVFLDLTNY